MACKKDTPQNEGIIERFLQSYNYAENTRKHYRSNLKKYFNYLGVNPETYFDKKRDYKNDLLSFVRSLYDRPPLTQKCLINSVKQFLSEYDVDLKPKVWRNIRNRGKRQKPVTQDKIPTNAELKQILQHGDIKERTLFLVLSSSGMRIGEATQIEWYDIDFEKRRINIKAEYTKTGSHRVTFFTEEAQDSLLEWKKVLEDYHRNKKKRYWYYRKFFDGNNEIKPDNRVFPFCEDSARHMWRKLIYKAGPPFNEQDKTTRRYLYHVHSLRKYFSARLKVNKMPNDMVERLMGHEEKYHGCYNVFTQKELHKFYNEHSPCLSVFSDMGKIEGIIESKLQEQNTSISSLVSKNKALNEEMETLRVELSKIKFFYKNVTGLIDPEVLEKIDKENEKREREKILPEEFLKYYKDEVPTNISQINK